MGKGVSRGELISWIKWSLQAQPELFSRFWRRREDPLYLRRVVRPGDAVVIEGFPRSSNTFATHAFIVSQPPGIKVGNHFHSPAQLLLARRYGIPALLVIRAPFDAVLSLMLFYPEVNAREGLIRYIAFHRPLAKDPRGFVVAPFDEVTTDFGRSIARLNEAFGTSFAPFKHSPESQQAVFAHIDEGKADRDLALGRTGTGELRNTTPSEAKEREKSRRRHELEDPQVAALLAEAQALYATLVARV